MAIDRKPHGDIFWQLARTEFQHALKVGSALFAVFALIFLAFDFSAKQACLMAALFLIGNLGVVGIDLPQEFKRSTGYPSFREVNWRVYAFAMSWTCATFASLLLIIQLLKGNKEYQAVAIAVSFGAILGAIVGALVTALLPPKRS